MAPRQARFTVSDVARALKGAKAAGVEIARCEIEPDGRIVLVPGKPDLGRKEEPGDSLAQWKAQRDARRRAEAQRIEQNIANGISYAPPPPPKRRFKKVKPT